MKRSVKVSTKVLMCMLAAALPLLALTARAAEAAAQVGPQELVTKVAQDTLRDLDAHRSEYKQNPKRVRELVDKNMLPHFDTAYSAQLVLAKYWRTATPEQRKRFVEAFYQSLLQNYGDALLEFTPDRLKILPFQGKADDTVATVRSEVTTIEGLQGKAFEVLRSAFIAEGGLQCGFCTSARKPSSCAAAQASSVSHST